MKQLETLLQSVWSETHLQSAFSLALQQLHTQGQTLFAASLSTAPAPKLELDGLQVGLHNGRPVFFAENELKIPLQVKKWEEL